MSLTLDQKALLLERAAVIRVVSDLRKYRAAAERLLASRYNDGEVDAVALTTFRCAIEEIETESAACLEQDQ